MPIEPSNPRLQQTFDTSSWGESGFNPLGRAIFPLVSSLCFFRSVSLHSGSPGASVHRVQKRKALASLADWVPGHGHTIGCGF